jgi:hypothetical protein
VVSLKEAKDYFHFNANSALDQVEKIIADESPTRLVRQSFLRAWKLARKNEDSGEWGKILKRSYRLAALAKTRRLRSRAIRDILENPELSERILDYIRSTGTAAEFLSLAEKVLMHPEQVYPDVNRTVFEALLRLEAKGSEARQIRCWAVELLRQRFRVTGAESCAEVAPLLLFRFGDGRSIRLLGTRLERDSDRQSRQVARACAVVYLSYGGDRFEHVRRVAARVRQNHIGNIVKMVEKIREYDEVPDRLALRLKVRFDGVERRKYVDMRRILQGRLLRLNTKPKVTQWLRHKKRNLVKEDLSSYDKDLIRKLL